MPPSFTISKVSTPDDLNSTISLFRAYADSLGIDLTFQDFAAEMASMPGKYAPPTGCLLLARSIPDGAEIGCVGLRPLGSISTRNVCEMKRLYVDSKGRGTGAGRALAVEVIEEARRLGYEAMKLDTLLEMGAARGLYRDLGFAECEAYYKTPIEGTIFLELKL